MILQCLRTSWSQQHQGSTSHWLNLTCCLISRRDPPFSIGDHQFQCFHVCVPCLKAIFKMRKTAYIGHLVFFANQDAAEKIKPCSLAATFCDFLFLEAWRIDKGQRWTTPSDCSLLVAFATFQLPDSAGSPSFPLGVVIQLQLRRKMSKRGQENKSILQWVATYGPDQPDQRVSLPVIRQLEPEASKQPTASNSSHSGLVMFVCQAQQWKKLCLEVRPFFTVTTVCCRLQKQFPLPFLCIGLSEYFSHQTM